MNIVKTILTILIVSIAGAFGFVLTPDDAIGAAIFTSLGSLSVPVQVGLAVALGLLVVVPMIAPYTPWTWDDKAIRYQSEAKQAILNLWNALASNFGKASNGK
jgi:hypothetical protein